MKNWIFIIIITLLVVTNIFTYIKITNLNKEISSLKVEKENVENLSNELKLQKKDCITITRGAISLAENIPDLLFLEEKEQNTEFNKFITLRNNLENSCKKHAEPERTEPIPLLESE